MPRRKVVDDDPVHSDEPKGEALPALEDFVRKLSGLFSNEIGIPEEAPVTTAHPLAASAGFILRKMVAV